MYRAGQIPGENLRETGDKLVSILNAKQAPLLPMNEDLVDPGATNRREQPVQPGTIERTTGGTVVIESLRLYRVQQCSHSDCKLSEKASRWDSQLHAEGGRQAYWALRW